MQNKETLIRQVALKLGTKKTVVAPIIEATLASVVKALASGEAVQINNFGVLSPHKLNARNARNPKTGAQVIVPARTTVKFRPAQSLQDAMATGKHPYLEKHGLDILMTLAQLEANDAQP